jgi:hypothetical protein
VSLHLHRSERADVLVEALAEVLAAEVTDPFAPDVVAVPARGIERWLSQRLAHTLGAAEPDAGVCANVRFPSPTALVAETVTAVTGERDEEDPWAQERVVWWLLDVIDSCSGEPWCVSASIAPTVSVGASAKPISAAPSVSSTAVASANGSPCPPQALGAAIVPQPCSTYSW